MRPSLRPPVGNSGRSRRRPRLTVALPLYNSARFLPVIRENLAVVSDIPDVEVLVSDRHGLDDTLDRLREEYSGDPRFRFLQATDGIGWVPHYNALLDEAQGEYVAWMPHDDTFPRGYYTGLTAYLDAHADALLAFGPLVGVDLDGRELEWTRRLRGAPRWDKPRRWSVTDAFRLAAADPWVPVRGVFRRDPIVDSGLALPQVAYTQDADSVWVFGVGLLGAVRFVEVPPCEKRFYSESTHQTLMPFSVWSDLSLSAAYVDMAFRYAPARALPGGLVRLGYINLLRTARRAARRVRAGGRVATP